MIRSEFLWISSASRPAINETIILGGRSYGQFQFVNSDQMALFYIYIFRKL